MYECIQTIIFLYIMNNLRHWILQAVHHSAELYCTGRCTIPCTVGTTNVAGFDKLFHSTVLLWVLHFYLYSNLGGIDSESREAGAEQHYVYIVDTPVVFSIIMHYRRYSEDICEKEAGILSESARPSNTPSSLSGSMLSV